MDGSGGSFGVVVSLGLAVVVVFSVCPANAADVCEGTPREGWVTRLDGPTAVIPGTVEDLDDLRDLVEQENEAFVRVLKERGLGGQELEIGDDSLEFMASTADGDARRALNTLEIAADLVRKEGKKSITLKDVEAALQKKSLLYDKKGEEHYNVISAFIKSMRGSDPDAAVYYLARMLQAGEDPLFIARRMVIFASEDVSNADPHAVQVAVSCMQSFDFVGMPEGWIPLAQCATYLASAPKSNASYMAYKQAVADVEEHGVLSVPKHLRNAPTRLMKELGYGRGYKYAHEFPGHFVPGEQYLPDKIKDRRYYQPTEKGYEKIIAERLKEWRSKKK